MEIEFDRLVDALPGLVWSAFPNGQAEFVNQRWCAYTGMGRDEASGPGWLLVVHPDDLSQLLDRWAACRASGQAGEGEARIRRHDGVYRWFNFSVSPVADASGKIVRWCGINTDIEEHKGNEAALRVSEQSLKQIINTLPTTAWATDAEGFVEYLSDRWLDYAGFTAEQGAGLGWGAAIHPDDAPGLFAYWQSCLDSGTPVDTEARMRRFDGEFRWFLFRANPLRDANGAIVKWFGTNIDIEDRKRADEALLASERSLRQIINTLPTTAWATDAAGYVEFLSDRWLEYAGFTAEQGAGLGWGAVIHPDDAGGLFAYWQSCLETGTPVDTEARMRRYDDEYRWFLFRANPLRDANGTILKWYGANIDIEDRKRADEALLASEQSLRQIINTIPTAVWSARADGYGDFLSDSYLGYAGVTSEQVEGWGWRAIIHPDDLAALEAHWQTCLETGAPVDTEARMLRFDGEYRWFLFRANPLRDANGVIVKWYGANIDIEDRKRADEALLASERNLKLTINILPTAAWSTLPNGYTDFLSDTYLAYAGSTSEHCEGWGWQNLIHPDDLDALEAHWQFCLATGAPVDSEARMRRYDGEYRWFLFRANPMRDADGGIIRWYGHNTDIEDRKRAESLLEGEKQLLAMVAQGRPLGEILDALCRIVERNAPGALCSILSIDPDGLRFRHGAGPSLPDNYNKVLDGLIIDSDYGPCGLAAKSKAQAIAGDVLNDPRWRTSPWPRLVVSHGLRACWSTPILSGDDRIIGVFALYQHHPAMPTPMEEDLIRQFAHVASIAIERSQSDAELRRTDDALRRANGYLEEAQRVSKSGSFTWDIETDEHNFSHEIRRTFGFGPDVKVTMGVLQAAVHPGDAAEVQGVLEAAGEGRDFDLVFRILRNEGEVRHVRIVGHRIDDITDRPVFLGALQDITDSKLAEDALTQARSELARVARVATLNAMTASIVHEVSQPLSGILNNANTGVRLLAADPPNLAGAAETLRRTVRDVNRASEVIRRLRAMFSAKPSTMELLDVNDVTREVIALSAGELRRSRALVEARFTEGLPPVSADRVQLQQVVLNLLLNAADSMAEIVDRPRTLQVTTDRGGDASVRLTVRDVGTGVDPENLEKLFEAFYTTKSHGMGVGLSISQSIIENHGGRLWAEANEGPGATFSFSIPLCDIAVAPTAQVRASRVQL